jgi:butyrate kinase
MIDYLTRPEDMAKHPSLIGSMIAFDLHKDKGIPVCIYDAIGTDEKIPLCRVSGVPELPHFTVGHTLNTRAMAIKCAEEKLGKKFEECTFIVAHLGGGSAIRLYKDGVNIDSVNDDEGNFTPERGGGVGAKGLVDLCYSGKYTYKEAMKLFHGKGGLIAHLGTADARDVEKMIADGDGYAAIVYEAMCLNVAKDICKLAATVCGKVDRIILTGGISYSKYVSDYITEHVNFICPVEVMAGEYEMEALAAGCLRVLRGEEKLQDFGEIAATAKDRIRIYPGVEPYTAPER